MIAAVGAIAIIVISTFLSYKLTDLEVAKAQELMLEGQRDKIKVATDSMAKALSQAVADVSDEQGKVEIFRAMIKNIFFEKDRSGYYYIYQGTTNVAHPVKPELQGKDLYDLKGKDGVYSVRELAREAAAGGGYLPFVWDKPGKNEPVNKLGYATMIPGTSYWIGTGVYIDNVDDKADAIRREMMSETNRSMLIQTGTALVLFALLLLPMILILSRSIINPILKTRAAAQKIAAGDMDVSLVA